MEQIYKLLSELSGEVGIYYKDLTSGEEFCHNEDIAFSAASIIKLPIMMEIYRRAGKGELSLCDMLEMKDFTKVGGCGVIKLIDEDICLSIGSLVKLMITISDNTATNILIRRIGTEGLKQGFSEMGLQKTMVGRELYDMEAAQRGIQNYFSPKEIGGLLESLYRGTFVSKEA